MFEEAETILSQIKNLQENASRMSATIADNAGLVRSLIVQAEDARIIGQMLVKYLPARLYLIMMEK